MEFVCFSLCGGLWSLRAVNLFMPPLDKLCLNSIPAGNLNIDCTVLVCVALRFSLPEDAAQAAQNASQAARVALARRSAAQDHA